VSVDYRTAGIFTDLGDVDQSAFAGVVGAPSEVYAAVPSLVVQPLEAETSGIPRERFATNHVRPAEMLVAALLELSPEPVSRPRPLDQRIVGTCRHFAVLACALLRRAGIESRVRCGFATYFQPGLALDHWIIEVRAEGPSWVRVDPEILGSDPVRDPEHLVPGEFLSGADAWLAFRSGEVDGSTFGVCGSENFGPAEIRGNLVKDLAALHKVESLPWDEWGRMTEAYEHRTDAAYDDQLDEIARAIDRADADSMREWFDQPSFRPPYGF
jgi:hypothetical protein